VKAIRLPHSDKSLAELRAHCVTAGIIEVHFFPVNPTNCHSPPGKETFPWPLSPTDGGERRVMAGNKKCAHPACNCHATEESSYCSPYCADAGDTVELACSCGHPGCAEELAHEA
jgi:hypothetical protein